MKTALRPPSTLVYTYDGTGNIITDLRPGAETFTYTYDKRNRLASVTRNGAAYALYTYNAKEQLASRTTSAVGGPVGTVHYIYDLDGHLIAEANGATGATTREYLWLPANDNNNDTLAESALPQLAGGGAQGAEGVDLPLAVVNVAATPTIFQVHTDHLGRPVRMTDAAKATVWAAVWKPWGEAQSITGTQSNNLRFPGQYFQIETNLAYNWHRHYDPVTGRYTQPDPLRFVDGPSVYAYAGSSPFSKTDKEGLNHWTWLQPRPLQIPGPTGPGGGYSPIPGRGPYTPWDDQIAEIWGMCKRAFGGGGDGCEKRFAAEQGRCVDRRWQMAHPDYFRGCMDRARERLLKCQKGNNDEPNEWGDDDEETGLDHGR
jgi:RHS repeat-associated protein